MTIRGISVTAGIVACLFASAALADAIVRTQAMLATTIAEIYVDERGVVMELEIGLADLEAFSNIMPDEIHERLGNEPIPLRDRLPKFFTEDLRLIPDDGDPEMGLIVEMGPRARIRRDDISGEPLPGAGEEEDVVVFVRIHYPLEQRPDELTISLRSSVSIGFVIYHEGVAVNDFRYLGQLQRLILDWDDPWYSKFDRRALRRTYFAPMSGFIYIEPYEVRKEIVARPRTLQQFVDLGLEGRDTIPVDIQDDLKRKVAEFLRDHHKVVIDGEEIAPELARINFLERTLTTSRVIDPPVELDINSAILGAIFVYPTVEPLPQNVTMDWDLFNDQIQMIPASAVDQAGALPTFLEPDFAVLEWQNFLRFPELPTLKAILPPPTVLEKSSYYLRWIFLLAVAWSFWWAWQRTRNQPSGRMQAVGLVIFVMALASGSFWLGQAGKPSAESSAEIVSGLLHNIYRAFDFRSEEDIYDVLDKSVSGDLLAKIYLETRRGLVLANQGGARAKVKDIEVVDLATRTGENGGFIANATWNVAGSVGHWGHVHQRRNRYQAELDIQPVDGVWKLTGLEILQEERL